MPYISLMGPLEYLLDHSYDAEALHIQIQQD